MGRHYYPLDFLHTATSDAYADKVMDYGPIAYWPLWELSGTTAQCLVNPAQNGTYSSDVSTWPVGPGIGDGNTAPLFDGNDYVNVHTGTLAANWPLTVGTVVLWARVANAGVWTDGAIREIHRFFTDGNNLSVMRRSNVNNQFTWFLFAGGALGPIVENGIADTGWMQFVSTWSSVAVQQIAYRDAVNKGALGCGAWAGALASAYIGAADAVPSTPWHGWLAHCAVWNRMLSPDEIAALAAV